MKPSYEIVLTKKAKKAVSKATKKNSKLKECIDTCNENINIFSKYFFHKKGENTNIHPPIPKKININSLTPECDLYRTHRINKVTHTIYRVWLKSPICKKLRCIYSLENRGSENVTMLNLDNKAKNTYKQK